MEPTSEILTSSSKTTDQVFNLMHQAQTEFNKENYDECVELLDQLESAHGANTTLVHNRAVAKFYKSNCKNYFDLKKVLDQLETEESTSISCYPNPIALYNKAVICFHRHMYHTAYEVLHPLFENFEKLDNNVTAAMAILYLRLMIANNHLKRAAAFLEVLQRHPGMNIEATDLGDESSAQEAISNVGGLMRTFKLLSLLTHILNRKNIIIPEDGPAEMAALKAHQYYIMKDFQMAAKQLYKISQIANTLTGLNATELNTCIANNMGVIHLRVRHYAIAAKFFQNAINFDKKIAIDLKNVSLQQMSSARTVEILYNLGIAMLHLRRPNEAFQAFLVPLKSYHNNPRLWFRMAEACIMDHEMKMSDADKKPMMKGTIQIGSRKHYVIKPSPHIKYLESSQSAAMPEPTLEFGVLCLKNALILTKLYRKICNKNHADDAIYNEDEQRNWQEVKDNNFCNPSTPISSAALDSLLMAIYAAYSYVCLRLGDYSIALEMAQELLRAENVTDALKLLGHMYAGEALIMMDSLDDARPHLDPTFVTSLNAFDFETKDWQVKSLDAAQNIVRYNLTVAMVMQGDLKTARNLINSCKHPIVAHKLKSLRVYINLKTGNFT